MIRILSSSAADDLLARKQTRLAEAEGIVRSILEDVRKRGDDAVREYAKRFDQFDREFFAISAHELAEAEADVPAPLRDAIIDASSRIRKVAQKQLPQPWQEEIAPGLKVGQVVRPLETICAYIPSGRYPLISTLLMTVIPAQVAGVRKICVATPRPVAE